MFDDSLSWSPTVTDHAARLRRLQEAQRAVGVPLVVMSPGADMQYFVQRGTGSHERLTALVVPAEGDAQIVCPALERPGWTGSVAEDLGLAFHTWEDGEDPYALVRRLAPEAMGVAIDDYLPAMHVFGLAQAFGVTPTPASPVIRQLRMRKTSEEVDALRAVGAAIDRVQGRIGEILRPGRTEADVSADLHRLIVEEGHTRPAFIIVGSGPNGASPHHDHSERVIAEGDCVVIDIGGPAPSGYQSDCTRTYIVGDPADAEMTAVHDIVRAAQQAGFEAAVAGATCESVDLAARHVIEQAGYGEYFITRVGHGIGFETHEHPYLVRGNQTVLEPGMAFSIEPGIYLPGRFGVRIEDIVVIGEDGQPMSMNACSKDATLS